MSSKIDILSQEFKDLSQIALNERENYKNASPYPHIVFKNIFNHNFLNDVLSQFPNLQSIQDSEKYTNQNEVKLSYNKYENFPYNIKLLFDFLNSKTFLGRSRTRSKTPWLSWTGRRTPGISRDSKRLSSSRKNRPCSVLSGPSRKRRRRPTLSRDSF